MISFLVKIFFLSLLFDHSSFYDQNIGTYLGAHDGDTIQYQNEEGKVRTGRLAYIDCPELKQSFGPNALVFTNNYFYESPTFTYHVIKKDLYGRDLIEVRTTRGYLNYDLISAGLAWVPCDIKKKEIINMEVQARSSRIGLWQEDEPVEPWNYRKLSKIKHCKRD